MITKNIIGILTNFTQKKYIYIELIKKVNNNIMYEVIMVKKHTFS